MISYVKRTTTQKPLTFRYEEIFSAPRIRNHADGFQRRDENSFFDGFRHFENSFDDVGIIVGQLLRVLLS